MLLLLISFVAGVLTVLAPCILPLLPVIVGGSISDPHAKRNRALIITGSLALSVIAFTLLLKASTLLIDISPDFWKWFSGIIIFGFGLTSLFPKIWERFKVLATINQKSNKLLAKGYKKQTVWGDVLIGAALGPIFTTCSPTYFIILATVLPERPAVGIFYLLAYAVGLSLSLLLISYAGQKIVKKAGVAANPNGTFKKVLGGLFILVAIFIVTGLDKKVEIWILDSGLFDVTKLEQRILQSTSRNDSDDSIKTGSTMLSAEEKSEIYQRFTEISEPAGFLNTENNGPITIAENIGEKVILVDFWTYSCINCQRTLPYLTQWYEDYKDQGLEIISIHTPEFAFEALPKNVEKAAAGFGVTYPIVLDNDYGTWRAYENRYWPRKYLIDIDGYVVYDHIGEGAYQETEQKIIELLNERARRLGEGSVSPSQANVTNEVDFRRIQTPETYLGSARTKHLINLPEPSCLGKECTYSKAVPELNEYSLAGQWETNPEYIMNTQEGAEISITFSASKVNLVVGGDGASAEILLNGQPITESQSGNSVENGVVIFSDETLYNLVDLQGSYEEHTLTIRFLEEGAEAYAFTFG